ncbi:DUF4268 domain-containing protein [Leeuwenhoekiella aestuarii]|uniref:DUF4268 domain-containing protein n=1 Tax=Leeuwenhoekiella aestuarii TaxID=2249426 RepID=A0A4Q0NRK5_9FLAO|nr:DUF4268 domain-containing protein [Leeuwenhoekiella aestuarii]RXG13260.1 putative protein with ParB-like and HNH nuclease domain [Leeuwenhoekiella aestuarii]
MKANELSIHRFLQAANVQFVIPVYQRNYDWTSKECGELFKDILSVGQDFSETHFIGSIVYIHEGVHTTNEVKELVIIDGQQRLTTINILYVALYRYAKENGFEQDADRLYNLFLINQYVQQESSKLKLKQTDTNSAAFKAIMIGTEKEFDQYSNVIENFNFFKSCITEKNFNSIQQGINRLIFVEISLEREKDDPQRIFESLNSTGLELSQSDLIRNFILMDLEPKEQHRIFEQIWNPIEDNAYDLTCQKSVVSSYIRDYLTLRNNKIPNKSKVYAEFKKLYANKKDDSYQQELENIKSLSVHYKKFINPVTVKDDTIRKELKYISRLEINVAYPFLLQVFEDAENGVLDTDTLIRILKLIQSYVWRRFIVGLPTNALNKIFMSLYAEIDIENYYESLAQALVKKRGTAKFPTDQEIKTALYDKDLYNIQSKNRSYLFEMLENYNNREFVDTSNELITIEHIFPQNPAMEWEQELPAEVFFMFKEKHLNTLANLTLSGNNGALGNKSFNAKKGMNKDGLEQGYLYSRLWLNNFLRDIDVWNLTNYTTRFDLIYERFLKIWNYPDVPVEVEEDDVEVNIFNADKPTGKKLEYFIFEETKYEETHIAQMYFTVLSELYAKNPQLLLDSKDIIQLSRNREEFRAPQELVNGYYVESNIDSNSKFRNLKKILMVFEAEDDLLVKFESDWPIKANTAKRFSIRREFWKQLLPQIENTKLFSNVNPTRDHWLSSGAGTSGVMYTFVITGSYARVELGLISSSKEKNKSYFTKLYKYKNAIEASLGCELIWEELPENKMSRIKVELQDVNLFDEQDWPKMTSFLIETLPNFEQALQPYVNRLK